MIGVQTIPHFRIILRVVKSVFLLLLLVGGVNNVWSQNIQFYVSSNNNSLYSVSIMVNDSIVAKTDRQGYAQIHKDIVENNTLGFVADGYKDHFFKVPADTDQVTFEVVLVEDESQLNEIIITAGRKPEHISTVPSSVTILNQQDIQSQSNITSNLASILGNAVPGLGTSTNKATNSGQTLRGRAVLVLVDGIPQSTPLMNGSRDLRTIDPLVIERIEVIKGATSI